MYVYIVYTMFGGRLCQLKWYTQFKILMLDVTILPVFQYLSNFGLGLSSEDLALKPCLAPDSSCDESFVHGMAVV